MQWRVEDGVHSAARQPPMCMPWCRSQASTLSATKGRLDYVFKGALVNGSRFPPLNVNRRDGAACQGGLALNPALACNNEEASASATVVCFLGFVFIFMGTHMHAHAQPLT